MIRRTVGISSNCFTLNSQGEVQPGITATPIVNTAGQKRLVVMASDSGYSIRTNFRFAESPSFEPFKGGAIMHSAQYGLFYDGNPIFQKNINGSSLILKIDATYPDFIKSARYNLGWYVKRGNPVNILQDVVKVPDGIGKSKSTSISIVEMKDGDVVVVCNYVGVFEVVYSGGELHVNRELENQNYHFGVVQVNIAFDMMHSTQVRSNFSVMTAAIIMAKEVAEKVKTKDALFYDYLAEIVCMTPDEFNIRRDVIDLLLRWAGALHRQSISRLKDRGIMIDNVVQIDEHRKSNSPNRKHRDAERDLRRKARLDQQPQKGSSAEVPLHKAHKKK